MVTGRKDLLWFSVEDLTLISLAQHNWFCPTLYNFWSSIFDLLSTAYSLDIQPDHNMAILACFIEVLQLSKNVFALYQGMVVAKKRILLTVLLYTQAEGNVSSQTTIF